MTTQGIYGFRVGGKEKFAYNARRSGPECLGLRILGELGAVNDWNFAKSRIEDLVAIHETRRLVSNDEIIRAELRRHFPDLEQTQRSEDFYDLFRPLQGTIEPYLTGCLSFIPTASEFFDDSNFCEWGYVLNCDNHSFEVYKGKQTMAPIKDSSCQGSADRMGYYPCRMIREYSLDELPSQDTFLSDLGS